MPCVCVVPCMLMMPCALCHPVQLRKFDEGRGPEFMALFSAFLPANLMANDLRLRKLELRLQVSRQQAQTPSSLPFASSHTDAVPCMALCRPNPFPIPAPAYSS